MVRSYIRKHTKSYTTDEFKEAVTKVKSGELRLNQASRQYKFPRTTLQNHTNGRSAGFKPGRKPVFDKEKLLLEVCFFMSDCFMGLDDFSLAMIAMNFAKMQHIKTPFKNDCPGPDWVSG